MSRRNEKPLPASPAKNFGGVISGFHARARTATIRAQLIHTPARIARSAGRLVLHLPRDWPWEPGLDELFRRALHDPLAAAA